MPSTEEVRSSHEEQTFILNRSLQPQTGSSQHKTGSATNEHLDKCFGTVFSAIGACMAHALCCAKTTRVKRALATWVWIGVIILTTAFCLRFIAFRDYKPPLSPGEQRPLDKHLSTFMCDSVSVGCDVTNIQTYLLQGKPRYNNALRTYKVNKTFTIMDATTDRYYLLPGSQWKFQICYTSNNYYSLYFFVVKGKKNLEECKKNPWYYKCESIISVPLTRSRSNCYEPDADFRMYSGMVGKEDDYYFGFGSSDQWNSGSYTVKTVIELDRTSYDLTNTVIACVNQATCVLGFGLNADVTPVVVAPDMTPYDEFWLTATCVPRWWVYLVLFAVLPLGLGFLFTIATVLCCRKRNQPQGAGGPQGAGSGQYLRF